MLYRVTRPATLTGPVKADYAYGPGDIVDSATAPEGHVDRLLAVGALEPMDGAPAAEGETETPRENERHDAASGRARPRLARAGEPDEDSLARAGLATKADLARAGEPDEDSLARAGLAKT